MIRPFVSLSGLFAIVAAAMIVAPAQSYEVGPVTGGGTIEGDDLLSRRRADEEDHPHQGYRGVRSAARGPDDPGRRRPGGRERGGVSRRGGEGKGLAGARQASRARQRQVPLRAGGSGRSAPARSTSSTPTRCCTTRTAITASAPPSTSPCRTRARRIPTELPRAGTVRVDCDAHGWMEGWIYVVDNPYYA